MAQTAPVSRGLIRALSNSAVRLAAPLRPKYTPEAAPAELGTRCRKQQQLYVSNHRHMDLILCIFQISFYPSSFLVLANSLMHSHSQVLRNVNT
jgi:hypothetical protein